MISPYAHQIVKEPENKSARTIFCLPCRQAGKGKRNFYLNFFQEAAKRRLDFRASCAKIRCCSLKSSQRRRSGHGKEADASCLWPDDWDHMAEGVSRWFAPKDSVFWNNPMMMPYSGGTFDPKTTAESMHEVAIQTGCRNMFPT